MKDVKGSNRGGGKPQQELIEAISEQVAGYMGGTRYALREWGLAKHEIFNNQGGKLPGNKLHDITLELRIDIEGAEDD